MTALLPKLRVGQVSQPLDPAPADFRWLMPEVDLQRIADGSPIPGFR